MDVRPSRRQVLKAGGLAIGVSALAGMGLPELAYGSAKPAAPEAPQVDYRFRDDAVDAATRLDDIMSRLTVEEKIAIAVAGASAAVPRLGLNAGRGSSGEGLHGVQGG